MSDRVSSINVLLVEDSPLNVELEVDLLEMRGHRVTVAGDAATFRAALPGCSYDVVLMDVLLPDTNGIELLDEYREDPARAAVPVIAVTAQALAGDVGALLLRGFSAVITKPIDTRTFVREIERVVEGARKIT